MPYSVRGLNSSDSEALYQGFDARLKLAGMFLVRTVVLTDLGVWLTGNRKR